MKALKKAHLELARKCNKIQFDSVHIKKMHNMTKQDLKKIDAELEKAISKTRSAEDRKTLRGVQAEVIELMGGREVDIPSHRLMNIIGWNLKAALQISQR